MPEIMISHDDIVSLAGKLDGMTLAEDERTLLSALVNAGGDTLVGASAPTMNKTELAASFKTQFESSFTPGVPPGSGGVVLKIRG